VEDRLHLLGIRHHGPGSAASVLAALDAIDPAVVLIEGSPEADDLVRFAALPGMRPPVALLLYAADDPAIAVFAPFAEFSPEWQAMLWALRNSRPVRFIDLPAGVTFAMRKAAAEMANIREEVRADAEAQTGETASPPGESEQDHAAIDPLDKLAEMAGESDGETWWNTLVESRSGSVEVFAAIETAMTALREADVLPLHGSAAYRLREDRREAHMRLEIRKALKETDGAVAAIVGAWHVPALRRTVPIADDKAHLRNLDKVKTEATWVPWTDGRLAAASGYGAGVISPGWYRHLWGLHKAGKASSPEEFAATWQARVAATLREAGFSGVTASAIEAARLAVSLAALRGQPAPGLEEMRDATLAALCHGDEVPYRVIERKLFIGEAIGEIDETVPQMPLALDLARWQKRARLKPEALEQEVALDLRTDAGLLKSILLHRLTLIDVPWGRLTEGASGRGTYREIWRLAWAPELSVKLAEALIYGATIEQAAGGAADAKARKAASIVDHAELVRHCLLADLPDAAEHCIAHLQAAAVNASDITVVMQAVPPLASILRYGTARKIPEEALSSLVRALAVEVNAGLFAAARNLDDEAAARLHAAMGGFDSALGLIDDAALSEEWTRQLLRLVEADASLPLIAGFALRRLHDRQAVAVEGVAAAFSRRLSRSLPPKDCGAFLEGFLGQSAEVIIHDRTLFVMIDGWLTDLAEEEMIELLPMLRRALASFDAVGRRRLLQSLDAPVRTASAAQSALSPAFAEALPLLFTILGITPDER
jgi:Family of unknown function (DUF5682)